MRNSGLAGTAGLLLLVAGMSITLHDRFISDPTKIYHFLHWTAIFEHGINLCMFLPFPLINGSGVKNQR